MGNMERWEYRPGRGRAGHGGDGMGWACWSSSFESVSRLVSSSCLPTATSASSSGIAITAFTTTEPAESCSLRTAFSSTLRKEASFVWKASFGKVSTEPSSRSSKFSRHSGISALASASSASAALASA